MASWKKIITSGSTAELNHISASGDIIPITTDGSSLGSINHNFSDLFLDSGAVINFDGDDVTLTHSSNKLTIGGGSLDVDGGIAIDNITIDGTEIDLSSGDLTIDVAGDVIIDADGGDFDVKDNGVGLLNVSSTQVSGSALSTGSFGTLHLEGTNFTSASLAAAIANDGDITGVDLTGQSGGITIDSETNTTSGNYSANIQLPTALTVPSSIKHDSLVIGRSGADDLITFSSGDISLGIGGTEVLGVDSTGVVVTGNLTVNGTTTTVNTTNTEVSDKFMFLASGSTNSTTDGGIIVSHGGGQSGSAFVYDASENRWGFPLSGSTGKTDITVSPEAYVSSVVTDDNEPTFRKDGNIRVQSGEIFIYVE